MFNAYWKIDAVLLPLFTINILTHWTIFYQPFYICIGVFHATSILQLLTLTLEMETEILFTPQNIPFEQSCYERFQAIDVTSTVLSSFFNVKTQRPKTDRKKCYKCNASIEFFLDVKVCFSPVTWKLMIKLHSLRSVRSLKFLHW